MAVRSEVFVLPSKGVYYSGVLPEGKVEVRQLTTEEIGMVQSGGSGMDRIFKMVRAALTLPETFTFNDMLVTDRHFLLLAVRHVSLPGILYKMEWKCPDCKKKNFTEVDLVKDIRLRDVPLNPEPIRIKLASYTVGMRFTRGKDEVLLAKKQRDIENEKTRVGEENYLQYRLALQLVDKDGEEIKKFTDKIALVRSWTMLDFNKVQNEIDKAEPGMDSELTLECSRCQAVNDIGFEFTDEFFRPTNI